MPGVSSHKRGAATFEAHLRKELKQIILDHSATYRKEYTVVWGWLYRAMENRYTELGNLRDKARAAECSQLDIIEEAGYLSRAVDLAEEILGKKKDPRSF